MEANDNQSQSKNDKSSQRNVGENQPLVVSEIQREPLYARFGKMKPIQVVGSTYPLQIEEWLSLIETILDFMHLSDCE